jgi:hypothetical protein
LEKLKRIFLAVLLLSIFVFVFTLFTVSSDETIWRVFSVTMPLIAISFWGAVIVSVIGISRSKKSENSSDDQEK